MRRAPGAAGEVSVAGIDAAKEIVPGDASGGANTSHTIAIDLLTTLLATVPADANQSEYQGAAVDGNALGKRTHEGRRRTFRYLRELYLLRRDSVIFRALRDLWDDDPAARPLLAGECALARDPVFRASATVILRVPHGEKLTSADLAKSVGEQFGQSYSESTLGKIGRNTFSSWEQTGHLAPATVPFKIRTRPVCRPANVAYALMLGYIQGLRGEALFETIWAKVLDEPISHLVDLAAAASQRGMIEFRHAGGVMEITCHQLLRPTPEGEQRTLL